MIAFLAGYFSSPAFTAVVVRIIMGKNPPLLVVVGKILQHPAIFASPTCDDGDAFS